MASAAAAWSPRASALVASRSAPSAPDPACDAAPCRAASDWPRRARSSFVLPPSSSASLSRSASAFCGSPPGFAFASPVAVRDRPRLSAASAAARSSLEGSSCSRTDASTPPSRARLSSAPRSSRRLLAVARSRRGVSGPVRLPFQLLGERSIRGGLGPPRDGGLGDRWSIGQPPAPGGRAGRRRRRGAGPLGNGGRNVPADRHERAERVAPPPRHEVAWAASGRRRPMPLPRTPGASGQSRPASASTASAVAPATARGDETKGEGRGRRPGSRRRRPGGLGGRPRDGATTRQRGWQRGPTRRRTARRSQSRLRWRRRPPDRAELGVAGTDQAVTSRPASDSPTGAAPTGAQCVDSSHHFTGAALKRGGWWGDELNRQQDETADIATAAAAGAGARVDVVARSSRRRGPRPAPRRRSLPADAVHACPPTTPPGFWHRMASASGRAPPGTVPVTERRPAGRGVRLMSVRTTFAAATTGFRSRKRSGTHGPLRNRVLSVSIFSSGTPPASRTL
jgi:hypothetical protein